MGVQLDGHFGENQTEYVCKLDLKGSEISTLLMNDGRFTTLTGLERQEFGGVNVKYK